MRFIDGTPQFRRLLQSAGERRDIEYAKIDVLVAQPSPPSLGEMVGVVGTLNSKQAVSRYLHSAGLYEGWKRKRGELGKKQKERREDKERDRLVAWIANHALNHAISREVIETYESFSMYGERGGLNRIKREVKRVGYKGVKATLKKAGIDPTEAFGRVVHSAEQKAAIRRAIPLDYFSADLAHFLRVPTHDIKNYRNKEVGEDVRASWNLEGRTLLWQASEVYEAIGAGFSNGGAFELLGFRKGVVERSNVHRKEIEPKIVGLLRTIYPTREQDVPYLTPTDRFD